MGSKKIDWKMVLEGGLCGAVGGSSIPFLHLALLFSWQFASSMLSCSDCYSSSFLPTLALLYFGIVMLNGIWRGVAIGLFGFLFGCLSGHLLGLVAKANLSPGRLKDIRMIGAMTGAILGLIGGLVIFNAAESFLPVFVFTALSSGTSKLGFVSGVLVPSGMTSLYGLIVGWEALKSLQRDFGNTTGGGSIIDGRIE